ncbi:MAG: hypothetical protein HZB42_12750 [Sphingobacteriales bacterium]|nr:hypothetical protein [Sphingobacteriales bacterium]
MKLFLVIQICFFLACSNSKADQENNITAFSIQELVAIIRDSSFEKFIALVNKPDYELDSSHLEENRIHYSAGDTTSDDGDYVSVQMTKYRHVHFLNFSTSNKKLYKQLERQVSEMGFKRLDDDPVVKDFTLGKVYLSIVIVGDEKSPSYMFSFVRDDRKYPLK